MTAFDRFLDAAGLRSSASPVITKTAGRRDLARLLAEMGYRRGAEVGVWMGEFSEVICQANPGVDLTCVDPWVQYKTYNEKKNNQGRLDDAYEQACARLQPYHCTILRMTSVEAAAQIPDGSLDFVYLDGNHARSFVDADLVAWVPKVRSGGIVAGHDYEPARRSKWIDVKAAVDAFTEAHQIRPWYVLALEKAPSFFWVVP
jgi:hypothetical protein